MAQNLLFPKRSKEVNAVTSKYWIMLGLSAQLRGVRFALSGSARNSKTYTMPRARSKLPPQATSEVEKCSNCGEPVPFHARSCYACSSDAGFPNVRAAKSRAEREALKKRVYDARVSTRARKCDRMLDEFGRKVDSSCAVICRSLEIIKDLVESENKLYVSFYRQIESGGRLPEDNEFDRGRASIDEALFPLYISDIVFAALSLNQKGVGGKYGRYAVVLREDMIRLRATTFEENPFDFVKKHTIALGSGIPVGYRPTWEERSQLAMAKLHHKITPSTTEDDFAAILLNSKDFVEVHIFGSISRKAISKVTGPKPRNATEEVLLKSIRTKLKLFGASYEEV